MAEPEARPNIRIEITNNLAEPMDVDDEKSTGVEEGEICENNETDAAPASSSEGGYKIGNRIWANANGGFTTGLNIFDKQEQEKLQERAKRFALKPDEISNFTDVQLQQLHDSLGITTENEKELRFEAIHIRGTDEMDTDDVFHYFLKYGPSHIEWIDDASCNVVWADRISAARALHFVSKPIKNLPIRGPCDPFVKDFLNEEQNEQEPGKSVLLRNANREVELCDEDGKLENKENFLENAVDPSTIQCPIPPGYWRLGTTHAKAKYILLRFAYKTDKKPYKAEKFSEYYKKHGNPNYGGLKGFISESKKQKFKGIFTRNRELQGSSDNKNPWAALAERWDEDANLREREYRNPEPPPQVKVESEMRNSLMERLGYKRGHNHVEEKEKEEEELPKKKIKMPRMRMYADEEEQKIKRKRQLMAIKARTESHVMEKSDLRSKLGVTTIRRTVEPVEESREIESVDLGSRLRNRIIVPERIQVVKPNDRYREDKSKKRHTSRSSSRRHSHERLRYDYCEEDYDEHKPRSKVAVVVRTQKKPTVASAIWSKTKERDSRTQGKLRGFVSSSESSSSSSSSSSSESSSSDSSSESEEETSHRRVKPPNRPGFNRHLKSALLSKVTEHKSPLKIEISNDHCRKE